jgi:hypothetical protein
MLKAPSQLPKSLADSTTPTRINSKRKKHITFNPSYLRPVSPQHNERIVVKICKLTVQPKTAKYRIKSQKLPIDVRFGERAEEIKSLA